MLLNTANEFGRKFNAAFDLEKHKLLIYSDNTIDVLVHNGTFSYDLSYCKHRAMHRLAPSLCISYSTKSDIHEIILIQA